MIAVFKNGISSNYTDLGKGNKEMFRKLVTLLMRCCIFIT